MATTWTQTTSMSTSTGSLQGFSGSVGDTGNASFVSQQLAFGANSNANSFTFAFTATLVQSLFMIASQNCTITTNNANSPTNTQNLVAGIPLVWSRSAGYFPQPFNANTNAGFLSCNAATILTFGVLQG